MIMKKVVLLAALGVASFGLVGCDENIQPTLDKYHVVLAPESLYNCPVIKTWPKVETLSDLQVARMLVQLAKNNNICKASMDQIHKFYNDAAARFEQSGR